MFESEQDTGRVLYSERRPRQAGDMDEAEIALMASRTNTPVPKTSFLDSAEGQHIHQRLYGAYLHEMDRQNENRMEMQRDDDLFDHLHYTEEELAAYEARGQIPIVYNITQTTINWVLGAQRRSPTDYRVLPRTKLGSKAADAKSQVLKHVADTNRSEFEWANAYASAVRVGLGWMECGQGQPEEGTKVFERSEDWRHMLWDSTAKRFDLQDARYIFRAKWLDTDLAQALWSKRAGLIRTSADTGKFWGGLDDMGDDPMDAQEEAYFEGKSTRGNGRANFWRSRVRVVEAWFKRVVPKVAFVRGGQFHGEMFDDFSAGHWNDILQGVATLSMRPAEVIHVGLFTDHGLIALQRSPFRHNRYPFTPVWGYRRASDGMPYGMIRGIRDVQRSFNKQKSKALHYLASTRVMVEEGAVHDLDTLRTEAARPDAVIVYKQGRPAPAIDIQADKAGVHVEMARDDAALIQSIGGVTDENMGRKTNATSGIAIERRQSQGQLATSIFPDNLRQAKAIHGEKLMVLIEMFYTAKDVIRITDSRGRPDWLELNAGDEDAIGAFKADFVLGEEDWRATSRQANFELMMGMLKDLANTAPQLVLSIIDLVIEGSDVPKKDEIVKRIREQNGMDDPDADPENPDPATMAKKQAAKEQSDLARRAAYADVMSKESEAKKKAAEAAKTASDVGNAHIDRLMKAVEAAVAVAGAQAVIDAADQVLQQASQAEVEAGRAAASQVAPQEQPMQPEIGLQQPVTPAAEMA